jgi:RNA polymerase sigma-70 factor (ECF subfamily)
MPGEQISLENPAASLNEEALIRRIRDGEGDLFYELIRPYERRVFAAALAILRNEADAEDAAQEAMLKAFKHIRQFRAESRFSTWLIQITVNEARMRRRKEHADIMEPIVDRQDEEGNYSSGDPRTQRGSAEIGGGTRLAGRKLPRRFCAA